ncbi:MAG TPA: TIR domain-containing protein [Thermoanaerobaculia bacterium]
MSTLFISHSSSDNEAAAELARRLAEPPRNHSSVFLDLDPEKGIVAGQSWERTLYRKLRACRAVIALCTDRYLASHWCFAEIALARMEGKHVIALLAQPLADGAKMPAILTEKQFVDLRRDPEAGYRRLWKGLEELDLLGVAGEWDPRESPYLGLRAYQEKHAAVFFGRGAETRTGLELLDRGAPGLIMVLGSSGSGKSSLVRAGMIPRLRRETDRWLVVDPFRPRLDPVAELAESLACAYRWYAPEAAAREGSADRIRETLEAGLPGVPGGEAAAEGAPGGGEPPSAADERLRNLLNQLEELRRNPPQGAGHPVRKFLDWSLDDLRRICGVDRPGPTESRTAAGASPLAEIADRLLRASGRRDARVLLVVDQFEELLGQGEPGDRSHRFLTLLRDSVEHGHGPLMVLGTMRSDFLGLFQRHRALRDVDFESLSVGPMSIDAMRRVIEEPARLGAIELEAGLADRLLADTETPDALPLLSFTLWRLWEEREGGTLSLAQYEALGGLHGAVAREAETVLAAARQQGKEKEVRDAFLRMAKLTDDGGYARQPVSWEREELRKVRPILEAFEKRRLLVTRQEKGEPPTVEVAHEALFRSWTPLKTWLDDNRAELMLRQQLRRDAQAWDRNGRAADNLWHGGRLQQAAELTENGGRGASRETTTLEDAFVRAGLRRRRVRRWTGIGIAALFFLGLGAGLLIALREMNEAQAQARIATSLRLATEAQATDRLDLALVLGAEAYRLDDSATTRRRLLDGLLAAPGLITFLNAGQGKVWGVAASADGSRLAAGGGDGSIALWDLLSCQPVRTLTGHQAPVWAVAVSPDGSRLASGSDDGEIRLWDALTGDFQRLAQGQGKVKVFRLAFSPDGTLLAAGSRAGLRLWDVAGDTPQSVPLAAPTGEVWGLAFNADGTRLVTGGQRPGKPFDPGSVWYAADGEPGVVTLWDPAAGKPVWGPREGHSKIVMSVAFSPDGSLLASGGKDGTVVLWDAASGERRGVLSGGHTSVWSVAFSPDGARLASGGENDGTIVLWDLAARAPVGEGLTGSPGSLWTIAFLPPEGRVLASSSEVGGAVLWSVAAAASEDRPPVRRGGVTSMAINPGGDLIAAGGDGGSISLSRPVSPPPATDAGSCRDRRPIRLAELDVEAVGEPVSAPEGTVTNLAFGPRGLLAAATGSSPTVRLWRSPGEPAAAIPTGHEKRIGALAISRDGERLASGGWDREIRLWSLDAGGEEEPLVGQENRWVRSLAFSPDGDRLAAGDRFGDVTLWNLRSGRPEGDPLSGHRFEAACLAVAFDAAGTHLAAGYEDGVIALWDLVEGRPVGRIPTGQAVLSVAFDADGTRLVSGGGGGLALWDVDPEAWRDRVCRKAARNLTCGEWERFAIGGPYRATCPDAPVPDCGDG